VLSILRSYRKEQRIHPSCQRREEQEPNKIAERLDRALLVSREADAVFPPLEGLQALGRAHAQQHGPWNWKCEYESLFHAGTHYARRLSLAAEDRHAGIQLAIGETLAPGTMHRDAGLAVLYLPIFCFVANVY
jgi:hypothetical protein